ncbi:MAG: 3-phytase [Actinomycetota bacterium]|nr:3-phytase [Actinomycetota bacterium]
MITAGILAGLSTIAVQVATSGYGSRTPDDYIVPVAAASSASESGLVPSPSSSATASPSVTTSSSPSSSSPPSQTRPAGDPKRRTALAGGPSQPAAATRTTTRSARGGVEPLIKDGGAPPTSGPGGPPPVFASVETELFPDQPREDVADDSAVWRNPARPDRSFILADNKADSGGVAVFDLRGKLVHYSPGGKIGNVDVRSGVKLGGRTINLVGANDRSNNTMRFWSLDGTRGTLSSIEARPLASVDQNYGFCLGRSSDGAHTYAFVSGEESGVFEQYELKLTGGKVDAAKVRSLNVGSLSEGCVVDDARNTLYIAEEDVGIWKYPLAPSAGASRTAVDRVGDHLDADVEGLAIGRGKDGKGVIVASSQGNSTFAVYDLGGGNAFRGNFAVGTKGSIDAVSETDGLSIGAGDLGPSYPNGLMVVHDADNVGGDGSSNLKLVRFDQVFALDS